MPDERKISLFDSMLFYISEVAYSAEDLKLTLSAIGFKESEIERVCADIT